MMPIDQTLQASDLPYNEQEAVILHLLYTLLATLTRVVRMLLAPAIDIDIHEGGLLPACLRQIP